MNEDNIQLYLREKGREKERRMELNQYRVQRQAEAFEVMALRVTFIEDTFLTLR
jgi:hypothetical protein